MPEDASTFDALILDLRGVLLIKTSPRVSSNKSIPSLKRFTLTLACSMKQLLSHAPQSNTEQVISWIQALRKDQPSLRIVAISNISKPDFDALHTRWSLAFWPLFDEVLTSSAVGMRNPNLGFYRHVLKSTGIDPRKIIFVDDNIQNIISAGSFGMQSVLFEDTFILARTVKTLLVTQLFVERPS